MDMSDLNLTASPASMTSSPADTVVTSGASDSDPHSLVNQLAAEIASPLTSALDRVIELSTTGAIDRHGLLALRQELEQARRAGIVGQQITRLANGQVQQTHERMNLTQMVREAMAARVDEIDARGIQVRQTLKPAEVIVDASLLFGLLQAMIDWGLAQARTGIEFKLDMKSWPAHARLSCSFGYRLADQPDAPAAGAALDSLAWRLIERIALTMQLPLERRDNGQQVSVTLEFPRTVNESIEGASVIELDHGFAMTGTSSSLAGSEVLVFAVRRDLRSQVRHALAHMGLVMDFAVSLDELAEHCGESLPAAIIFDSTLASHDFETLRADLLRRRPELAFIEITEHGHDFEMSTFDGATMARVGRDAIVSSLPSALMFELAKGY